MEKDPKSQEKYAKQHELKQTVQQRKDYYKNEKQKGNLVVVYKKGRRYDTHVSPRNGRR